MELKVGDKVKVVGRSGGHGFSIGEIVNCVTVDDSDDWHRFTGTNGATYWMPPHAYVPIQDDPVNSTIRTRTVTEIVPGVYGKVVVASGNNEHAAISIGSELGPEWMSRADLIAARDVFNQLIDAMTSE